VDGDRENRDIPLPSRAEAAPKLGIAQPCGNQRPHPETPRRGVKIASHNHRPDFLANPIRHLSQHGIAVRGGTLYSTISPCLLCAKMIINAGLVEVVYESAYQFSQATRALLRAAGVPCRRFRRGTPPPRQSSPG
ncbi:MAG: hypothetical protein NTV49_06040, partial [Kiritimatiellaeota bacterium]|nr:hypothetical protein [Kiritimatiellota bacterium]